ncbi:MAG TPA: hypothetical protein VE053_06905 [Allosphingosinicella sp.]|nr:hypothetical protein [Allosphingosinicella sp.]
MTVRERLARWLAPNIAQDADAYGFLRNQLSDAQRWLSGDFPVVDAVIHWAGVRTRNHFRGLSDQAFAPVPGMPWINDMHEFRTHLRTFHGAFWTCKARLQPNGPDDPADCDWPICGCDPHAAKVVEALEESGALGGDRQASDPSHILDYEPHLAEDPFGPERSIRWLVYNYYGEHLPSDDKARAAADRYVAAITALIRDSGRLPKGEDPSGAECEASQSGPKGIAHPPHPQSQDKPNAL